MRSGNFGSLDFRPFTRLGSQGADAPPVTSVFILQRSFLGGTLPPEVTFARNSVALDPWTLDPYAANEPRIFIDRGLLIESGSRNLCTIHNAKPTDLTGVTQSGDPFAFLSLVDDTTNLQAAGLNMTTLNGNVFRLDNLLGGEPAYATVAGATTQVDAHGVSAYIRAEGSRTGLVRMTTQTQSSSIIATGYELRGSQFSTASIGEELVVQADPGCIVYFIMPQLEENFITSPIETDGQTRTRASETASEALVRSGPCTWGLEAEVNLFRFGDAAGWSRFMTLYDGAGYNDALEMFADKNNAGLTRYRVRTGGVERVSTSGTTLYPMPPDYGWLDGISEDANYRWYSQGVLDATQTPAGINVPDTARVAYGYKPDTGGDQLGGYVRRAYVATAEIVPTPPEPPEPPEPYPGSTALRFRLAGDGRIDLPVPLDGGVSTLLTFCVGLTTHGADRAMIGDANAIIHHVWLAASQHGAGWGVLTEDKINPPDAIQTEVEHKVEIRWIAGSGNMDIAVDGTTAQTFPLQSIVTDGSFTLGDHTGTPGGAGIAPWIGYIRDVKLYDNGDQSTLTHHWPLDEGSGTIAHDAVDPTFNGEIIPGSGAWDITSYPDPSRHLVFAGDTFISCPVTINAGESFKIEVDLETTETGTKRIWTAGDSFDEISGPGAAVTGTGTVGS